ncbi:carbohydrate ABC transporter permease [Salinispora arenicola]|uniref:Binding-protein-dependent transport systems inner membrane component n=1 Tax=Salinispora arenicola (strain CNS-205) TaxID=391037 RepID=A8M1U8_SALAI|nr:carbohydrate ABC transporter permease [Salinispora arenicola]MCN0179649.1 carbohydrate ABC transporter permease [Salinispora arenicola]NIL58860.1 carbohydrate ABC transporter permease [Salinispora arenicola]NIL64275.1 carbohydrate ABC transporter permease [Salinispora arenicola]
MTVTTTTPALAGTETQPTTVAGRVRKRLNTRWGTAASILIAIVWTIPTFGLLVSSFRPEDQIKTTGWWTFFSDPQLTLENYEQVLFGRSSSAGQLASYFVNSIVITLPSVLFPLAFAALAAYALAWINFRGRDWIYIGIFTLQIVPLQMALVPLLSFFSQGISVGGIDLLPAWNLDDEQRFLQVWFAHTCFALPLGVFLLHNFVSQLPRDLMEAARVDGATHPKIFRTIVLPLITPALAAYGIFQFLWVWNDLLVALIFAGGGDETAPLTVRLAELAGTRGNEWQRLTAGAFVAIVVPLLVFLSLQRYFVRGLLAGSVKG